MDPHTTTSNNTTLNQRPHRVLAVADWDLDPRTVAEAVASHDPKHPSHYALLVPVGLHGLDWAGEPRASRPCAERQLLELKRRLRDLGVPIEMELVGDPEAGPAINDAVYEWPADEILIFGRARRLRVSHPLNLIHRVERATGLPVSRIRVPARAASHWRLRTTPQCAAPASGFLPR